MDASISIIVDDSLYLNKSILLAAGISSNTIFSAQQRGTNGWEFTKLKGVHALYIAYEPLINEYKERIKEYFKKIFKHDNVYRVHAAICIDSHIRPDDEALKFFREHTTVKGTSLGEDLVKRYHKAAMVLNLINTYQQGTKTFRKQFGAKKTDFYAIVYDYINSNNIDLPSTYENLIVRKYKEYTSVKGALNYACLISGRVANTNRDIITGEVAEWLIAKYALPTKIKVPSLFEQYNQEATARGWKEITSHQAIHSFLHKPEIERQWFGGRNGWLLAKEKYGYQLATILPTMRDALWYADGTKLNYFDKAGKLKAAYTVYKVIDVFSEVILGWHISESEDHVAQYHAFKNAMKFSGRKPYEIKVDNQGGHQKIKTEIIDKLTHVGIFTQPHNGKSKTIENLIGRFQQQVMREDWFFAGQNITTRTLDSRANIEFIIDNMKHLPSIETIKATFGERIEKWHNKPHFLYKEVKTKLYAESENPNTKPFSALDMVETFWLTKSGVRDQGIVYHNHGITLEITSGKNNFKSTYEVLDSNGFPDEEFRKTNLYKQFHIRYDLDDLSLVRLYTKGNNGLEFVTIAENRIKIHRALQDQDEGERLLIGELLNLRKKEVEDMKDDLMELEERTGVAARDLVTVSVAQYQKEQSYWDEEPRGNGSIYDKI